MQERVAACLHGFPAPHSVSRIRFRLRQRRSRRGTECGNREARNLFRVPLPGCLRRRGWCFPARREWQRRRALKALREAESVGDDLTVTGPEGRPSPEALFRRQHKKVVTWCLRFTGDKEEANDLAQSIFLKAFRQLGSFRGESKISTWLYSITRSECMNYLKARSARPPPLAEDEVLGSIPDAAALSPFQMLERARCGPLVQSLLDRALDDTEKRVFTLHYGDEMPLDVITRLLGLTNRSGAKAFIVSARRKISRLVQQWNARELRLFMEGGAR